MYVGESSLVYVSALYMYTWVCNVVCVHCLYKTW
jgi:hypothetical protein